MKTPSESCKEMSDKELSSSRSSHQRPSTSISNKFKCIQEEDDIVDHDGKAHVNICELPSSQTDSALKADGKFQRFSHSHSFSGVLRKKRSNASGSAKSRAIQSSMIAQRKAKSMVLSADQSRAVNDYYGRHLMKERYNDLNSEETLTCRRRNGAINPVPTIRKFHKSIYWILHNRGRIGFRHLCLLLLVLSYTLLGAVIFYSIESPREQMITAKQKAALDAKIDEFAGQVIDLQNGTGQFSDIQKARIFMKNLYIELLKQESLFIGSTYQKVADSKYKWTFGSAVFFSMNIYTTTGYGSIAAESTLGRSCVIIYALLTVPITIVVARDLGQWTLVMLTKVYAHSLVSFRRTMGYSEPSDDSMISLPIRFCLTLLASYLLFSTIFVYVFDEWNGDAPHTGVSIFIAFYFSFVSISSVGLGDAMPNNATFHPLISTIFFFSMPIMRVVNRATYICIENGIFGALTLLERSIDRLSSQIEPTEQPPALRQRSASRCSHCSRFTLYEDFEEDQAVDLLNNLTVRSLGAFARANTDIYAGGFGRVSLRKSDLVQPRPTLNQGSLTA